MDIQYLLWLQGFRSSIDNMWTPAMEWVSMFATTYLILIPIFLYWYRDKRQGLFTRTAYSFCMVFTPLIKLTACVYRPWIRDSRILPAGDSIRTATGYSFPSGHTSTCGPLAGGTTVSLWEDKRLRWLSVILVLFALRGGVVGIFFREGTEFYRIASLGYLICLPACLFVGMNIFGSGLFTAFGNGLVSGLLSLIRSFAVLTCCLFGLTALFGGEGLWSAWPAAELISLFVTLIALKKYRGKYQY